MKELFLIELLCEDTDEWVEMEFSPNPYPVPGGDADQLTQAGALYRWLVVQSNRPLKVKQ